MYDSINHLDETSCIKLLEQEECRQTYLKLFLKLRSMMSKGADVIICDCSRYNLYPLLKIKNPIDPGIEWEKHHKPDTWIELLREAGFSNPIVRWTTFNPLGYVGKFLLGNKFCSYFLTSHFRLTMKCKD